MVSPFIKYLSFEKRYSPHTIASYRKDLEQLSKFLKAEFEIDDPSQAKHPHLRGWIASLSDSGLSPKSVNRKMATLKSFYKYLLGRDYIELNPTSKLKPLKTDKDLPTFVKENEIEELLDMLDFGQDFEGKRDQLLLELFYATGMRLSELSNLKETDINHYEKTIKVLGKRSKERILPIPDSLTKLVDDYLELKRKSGGDDKFLIVTDSGKKTYPMFIQRKVKKYLKLVTTLSKKSPHVLRHTFATHLLNKGADLNAVKDLLGHASLAATQVYTHNSIEKLKEAFNNAHPKA